MNRSAKGLLIVTTNLDGFSLQITDDSPILLNFLPAKLSCYTVFSVNFRRLSIKFNFSGINFVQFLQMDYKL